MERLNPLNDVAFKKIMGEEENKGNLISFLNAVLSPDDRKKLVSLEIIDNKELTVEMLTDKAGRLDVRAKTEDGTQLDIEVQLTNQHNMDKRTMFYWGKLFLEGIKKGEDYVSLSKVITINILDFDYLDIEKFHSRYHLWEDEVKDYLLTDLIEIHFIEIPKFKRLHDKNIKGNPLHRWLQFFNRDLSEDELKELMEMDTAIKRAEAALHYLSNDKKEYALYQARENALHERANMISTAKAEGREEGINIGVEKGINIGVEKGILMVARNMYLAGDDIDKISSLTGIAVEELKNELEKKE